MANITYPDLDNNFPNSIDNFDKYSDVTASAKPLVDQYYTLYNAGNFNGASELLENNPTLKNMIINAESLNKIRDAVISIERYYTSDVQQYIINAVKNKQTWSSTVQYSSLNVVTYETNNTTSVYMAIYPQKIPVGTLPTDTNYWTQLSFKGDKGDKGQDGTGLVPRGIWAANTQYNANDMVSQDNSLWTATENNIGKPPTATSTYWTQIMSVSSDILTIVSYEKWLELCTQRDEAEANGFYAAAAKFD